MPHEPADAPVPDRSKKSYYIWLAVAIVVGGLFVVFILPNLYFMTAEGPSTDGEFEIRTPGDEIGADIDDDPEAVAAPD
jgi:hypothetical protein